MERRFRGKTVRIEVQNPKGLNRGIASLTINGKALAGDLVPSAELTDGAKVVAILG